MLPLLTPELIVELPFLLIVVVLEGICVPELFPLLGLVPLIEPPVPPFGLTVAFGFGVFVGFGGIPWLLCGFGGIGLWWP